MVSSSTVMSLPWVHLGVSHSLPYVPNLSREKKSAEEEGMGQGEARLISLMGCLYQDG